MTVGIGLRDLHASIGQPESSIDMKGRAPSGGRSEVRLGGPGVVGAVEVLCVQRKVLFCEPLRSPKVQFSATGSKQGGIGSLLNKRMREQEIITLRKDQGVDDEAVADIVRFVDEVPQQGEIKTLADNRCSLKRLPVTLRQSVHAREDQTLDGCGDGISASFFRVVQKLFQKERIAARALNACKRDRMTRVDEPSSQAQRLVPSQWTQIDGREWCSTATCAPRSVKRVALDTRRHGQKAGTVRYGRCKRRKMPEHLRISPMEILHNE